MPQLEANGITINYETEGDPESPSVILLHGFTADLRMWAPVATELSADYHVVMPDLRGHGRTSAPENLSDYSIENFAADVAALLDALEADLCAVVGCSFGGMVALQFAVTWPERLAGLVISDASPAYESDRYDDALRAREAGTSAEEDVVRRFGTLEAGKRASTAVADPFLAEGIRRRYAGISAEGFLGGAHARKTRPDLIARLRENLPMPLLICIGEKDPVGSGAEVIAAEVPSARYVTFRGAGHGVPFLRPDTFSEVVLRFFADIEEGTEIAGRSTV